MSAGFRTILKNVTSMTAMRLFSAALSFLLVVCIARMWGTVPLGQFSLLLSFFIFLQQMPLMGLHLVVVRDTAAHPDEIAVQAANMMRIALVVSVLLALLFGLGGGYAYRANVDMSHGMWLIALSIIPTGFVCVVESILIGQQRMHMVAGWNIAENIARTVASLLVLWLGMGITAVFAVFLLGRLLIAAGYYRGIGFAELVRGVTPSRARMTNYLRQVPTFLGIMLCAAAINRLDFILLSVLGNLRDVGFYSAPYKVYEIALMAPSLIAVVLLPVFSACFRASRQHFDMLFETTVRILLVAAIPCIGLTMWLAPAIMLLFGHEYVGVAWILQLMLATVVFVTLNQLFSLTMLVSNHPQLDFTALAWSCVVYAIALALSIPVWGLRGAAWSTFAVALLQPLLRYRLLRKKALLAPIAAMLTQLALAAAAMAAAYFAVAPMVAWLAPIAALLAYGLAIWLLKGITLAGLRDIGVVLRQRHAGAEQSG